MIFLKFYFEMENNNGQERMAMSPKGLRLLLVGFIVMVSGYILMTGGGSDDPQVFNYAIMRGGFTKRSKEGEE